MSTDKENQITADEAGDILIPERICERLHLSHGITMTAEANPDGGLRLRVVEAAPTLIDKGGVLVANLQGPKIADDLVREDREERMRKLLGRLGE